MILTGPAGHRQDHARLPGRRGGPPGHVLHRLPADHGHQRVDDLRDHRRPPAHPRRPDLPARPVRRGHRERPLARDRRAEPLELRPGLRPAVHRAVGSAVVLPFKRKGQPNPLSLVPRGVEPPEKTDVIRVPANWRIIATMNVFDKNLLFDMSYALMRRFAFIEVGTPERRGLREAAAGPRRDRGQAAPAAPVHRPRPRRLPRRGQVRGPPGQGRPTESRLLYEVFYAYFLPQFEGMEDRRATTLYRTVAQLLDPPEQAEAQRTITRGPRRRARGLSRDRRRASTRRRASRSAGEPGHDRSTIWDRLSRPFDVVAHRRRPWSGCPPTAVDPAASALAVATSPEAEALLDAHARRPCARSPRRCRPTTERCIGELRGPVLWSETMSARASSFGDDGPVRVHDAVAGLRHRREPGARRRAAIAIRDAGQDAERHDDRGASRTRCCGAARRNGNEASRFARPPVAGQRVSRERPKPRAIKRTRSGKHRKYLRSRRSTCSSGPPTRSTPTTCAPLVRRAHPGPARAC